MASDDENVVDEEAELEDDIEAEGTEQAEAEAEAEGQGEEVGGEAEGDEDEVDSSEEEEEEANEYEKDGFLVDDVEEEDGEPGDKERKRKKKKRKKERKAELELDEDDYDLVEEHLGGPIRRQAVRKRLKKAGDDDKGRSRALDLDESLFGSDELADEIGGDVEDDAGNEPRAEDEEAYDDDDDEMDDFIADAPRRKKKASSGVGRLTGDALQEMFEIFGEPEEADEMLARYEEMKQQRKMTSTPAAALKAVLDEEEADDEEEPDLDGEEYEEWAARKDERAKAAVLRKTMEVLDPELAARHHLLPIDQQMVAEDWPERLQEAGLKRVENMDYVAAADWIYDHLFSPNAPLRREKKLVMEGRLEVSWNPINEDSWPSHQIIGAVGPLDLFGRRGIRQARTHPEMDRWQNDDEEQRVLKDAIRQVLVQVYEKGDEVPYIAMHKKDLAGELLALRQEDLPEITSPSTSTSLYDPGTVQPHMRRIRRWEALWAVYESSALYTRMLGTKDKLKAVYESSLANADTSTELSESLMQCILFLDEATTDEAIMDAEAKYKLITESIPMDQDLNPDGPQTLKRPARSTPYRWLQNLGIEDFVRQMALAACSFGENVEMAYKRHEPEDPKHLPEDVASAFVREEAGPGAPLADVARVIKQAKSMAAYEVAGDAHVRQGVRELFFPQALLSTEPTEAGEALDPMDPLGAVKRLRNKRVETLQDSAKFLMVLEAARKKLITFSLAVPEEVFQTSILTYLSNLYVSENVNPVSAEWNKLRVEVLREALLQHLLPKLEKDLVLKLKTEAQEALLHECNDAFWALASRPPLRVYEHHSNQMLEATRIMAVIWGDTHPTVAVVLDQHGLMKDLLPLPQLTGQVGRSRGPRVDLFNDPRRSRDAGRIEELIKRYRTTHIVLGCSNPKCRWLEDDLQGIINHILDTDPQFLVQELEAQSIDLVVASEAVPTLYQDCIPAKEELSEYPPHVRRAVGLGRFHIDPLAVLAALSVQQGNILSLQLHPMQGLLPPDTLRKGLDKTLITAVCQVGVDLNCAAHVTWRSYTLPYAAGMGPRKAAQLLKDMAAMSECAYDRADVRKKTFLANQKTVFRNVSSFLRIRDFVLDDKGLGSSDFKVLDDTRIPPDVYGKMALRLAQAIAGPRNEEEDLYELVEQITAEKKRSSIESFDLAPFVVETDLTNRVSQVVDMKMELLEPYGEIRAQPPPLNMITKFYLMHGESEDSLKTGRKVDVRIVKVLRDQVRCMLQPSNAEAVLMKEEVKSGGYDGRLDSLVQPNQVLSGRVIKVDTDLMQQMGPDGNMDEGGGRLVVYISTRSDFTNPERWEREVLQQEDPDYYILTQEEKDAKRAAEAKDRKPSNRPRPTSTRTIKHPLFHNVTLMEATSMLEGSPDMSCIIRPANNPHVVDRLSMTLKFHVSQLGDHIFVHKEVRETKDPKDPSQRLRLGTPLLINLHTGVEESYEDLDEVYARFVEPFLARAADVSTHRKFTEGYKELLEQQVLSEKRTSAHPNQLQYRIGFAYQHPGMCIIVYSVPGSSRTHHEYFQPVPEGYWFRKRTVPTLEHVLAMFKKDPTYAVQKNPHNPHGHHMGHPHGAVPPRVGYAPHHMPPPHAAYPQAPPPMYGGVPGGYPPAAPHPGGPYGGYQPVAAAPPGAPAAPPPYSTYSRTVHG